MEVEVFPVLKGITTCIPEWIGRWFLGKKKLKSFPFWRELRLKKKTSASSPFLNLLKSFPFWRELRRVASSTIFMTLSSLKSFPFWRELRPLKLNFPFTNFAFSVEVFPVLKGITTHSKPHLTLANSTSWSLSRFEGNYDCNFLLHDFNSLWHVEVFPVLKGITTNISHTFYDTPIIDVEVFPVLKGITTPICDKICLVFPALCWSLSRFEGNYDSGTLFWVPLLLVEVFPVLKGITTLMILNIIHLQKSSLLKSFPFWRELRLIISSLDFSKDAVEVFPVLKGITTV